MLGLVVWIGMEVTAPDATCPPQLAGLIASLIGMLVGSLVSQGKQVPVHEPHHAAHHVPHAGVAQERATR